MGYLPLWDCRRAERLISRALDGPLSPQDAGRLARHLAACDSCRAKQALYSAAIAERAALGETHAARLAIAGPATGTLAERAMAARTRESFAPSRRASFPLLPVASGVLGIGAAAALGFAAMLHTSEHPLAPLAAASPVAQPTLAQASPAPHSNVPQEQASHDRQIPAPQAHKTPSIPAPAPSILPPHPRTLLAEAEPHVSPASRPFRGAAASISSYNRPVGDDLAFVNTDSTAFTTRWTRLTAPQAAALEARLRASVRSGDEFVEVPLPRLASADPRVAAEAIRSYKQQREIVDARLQRAVTVADKGISFTELCAELSKATGVQIEAAPSVADDKITLFCTDRSARDIMRAITRLFDFYWERFGEEGAYRYRLIQPLRAQLLEEELRNRDRNEALLALDKEMDRYKSLTNLSPDEAREKAKTATGHDKEMLENYGNSGWGPINLYFGLSSDQMNALRAGQSLGFRNTPSGSGPAADVPAMVGFGGAGRTDSLPDSLSNRVLQSMSQIARVEKDDKGGGYNMWINSNGFPKDARGVPPSAMSDVSPMASLRLSNSELGRFELQGGSGMTTSGDHSSSAMMSTTLAVGVSPSSQDPKNAEANKGLANQPGMKDPLKPLPTPRKDDKSGKRRVTTADILEAYHRATGRDVIGDYYIKLFDADDVLPTAPAPLFDALCHSCDAARLRWGADDNWLTFRSSSFFNDRLKEVPNRFLERWANARKQNNGNLPLENLLEIARLSDTQLDGKALAEGVQQLYGLEEWSLVRSTSLRSGWRLLNEISPNLRQAALTPAGLPFSKMPLGQQEVFATAVFGSSHSPEATQENLAAATLSAFYGPKPVKTATVQATTAGSTKPQPWTASFSYRWKSTSGPMRKVVTATGTMSGNDNGKEWDL